MNIAQALAIAAAGYVYALSANQTLPARFEIAHAELCATIAEAETIGEDALADAQELITAALQQSENFELRL